ncbi:MAG: SUMF1/EgtB/PvdO family nonheme iron enzyme [Nitrospirae bacterium]|nr:SUMF1/EgtB/PvdO family nonheme iron enzyme [Candidatus Manganitrophaceae bacterium]
MKEVSILLGMGVVFLLLIVISVARVNSLRSEAKAARARQAPRVVVPAPDPSRFNQLRIAPLGKDAAQMVFVPGGTVWMGSREERGEFDEKPARQVTLHPYFIDLYEVTNTQYQRFVQETHRHRQEVMVFFDDTTVLFQPKLPAVGVSWFDADAYCVWNGKRLPTEAEWEHAARGEDNRPWPWGENYAEGYANARGEGDGFAYTAPVGSFEAGRSPYGLYDMAGNVLEWVYDWYSEFYYKEGQVTFPKGPDSGIAKAVRGGSWDNSGNDLRTTKRVAVAPYRKEATIGFRCAMEAAEDTVPTRTAPPSSQP